jgi:hypothetical protein
MPRGWTAPIRHRLRQPSSTRDRATASPQLTRPATPARVQSGGGVEGPSRQKESLAQRADGERGPRRGGQQVHAAMDGLGDVLRGGGQGRGGALVRPVLDDEAEDPQRPMGQAAQIRGRGDQSTGPVSRELTAPPAAARGLSSQASPWGAVQRSEAGRRSRRSGPIARQQVLRARMPSRPDVVRRVSATGHRVAARSLVPKPDAQPACSMAGAPRAPVQSAATRPWALTRRPLSQDST